MYNEPNPRPIIGALVLLSALVGLCILLGVSLWLAF